ncbi:RICIN domain-containing protein [Kribbella sp. NPDC004536]|uniref:RICIN domain-containing protein n=1 Tax=Kribbella sp. NPDC004536 TaxID=3364106 RepID=UPI0036979AE7
MWLDGGHAHLNQIPTSEGIGSEDGGFMQHWRISIKIRAVVVAALAALIACVVGAGGAHAATGPVSMRFEHSQLCLHIIPSGYTDQNRAIQAGCTYNPFSRFTMWYDQDTDAWAFRVEDNNKCLAPEGSSSADRVRIAQQYCVWGNLTLRQEWRLVPVDNGYEVVNAATGKCMDVEGDYTNAGARVWQYTCDGGANQQVTLPIIV